MLFESNKCVEERKLEVGDIIEFSFSGLTEIERRLIVNTVDRYCAIDIVAMTISGSDITLNGLLNSYQDMQNFRIIKSENLKIVEVV